MFLYHNLSDEARLRFYQTPKVLLENDRYDGLGLAEMQMYAVLRDRQELSRKNKWIDENGHLYLIFTVESLSKLLRISTRTAIRYKKNLQKFNLLKEVKQGRGKPNRIYIGQPTFAPKNKKCQKYNSRSDKSTILEVTNCHPNDTDFNDTDIYSASKDAHLEFFEEVWKLYPHKRGKAKVSNSKKEEIFKLADEFKRCIERYKLDVKKQRENGFPELKFQIGSTFFNSGYVDYLDENYKETMEMSNTKEDLSQNNDERLKRYETY